MEAREKYGLVLNIDPVVDIKLDILNIHVKSNYMNSLAKQLSNDQELYIDLVEIKKLYNIYESDYSCKDNVDQIYLSYTTSRGSNDIQKAIIIAILKRDEDGRIMQKDERKKLYLYKVELIQPHDGRQLADRMGPFIEKHIIVDTALAEYLLRNPGKTYHHYWEGK